MSRRKRHTETRWQRFWRKRRMNALRNSSDHAMFMALAIVGICLLLGVLVYLGTSGIDLGGIGNSNPALNLPGR